MGRLLIPATTASAALLVVGLITGCGTGSGSSPTPVMDADDARANDATYQCMVDKGVPVTQDDDGSVGFRAVNDAGARRYNQAQTDCNNKLVADGVIPDSNSPAQLAREHEVLTALRTCLVDAGFPMADWPTKEVFIENDGQYNALDSTAPLDDEAIHKACAKQFRATDSL